MIILGNPIHDLLMCAVYDGLNEYMKFYAGHKEFMQKMNLDHNQMMKKMRILTLISMAEKSAEVSFSQIQKELQLEPKEVERFIIDALKTKLLTARIDQATQKVTVQSAVKRALSKAHWIQIRDTLTRWKASIHQIKDSLHELDTPIM
jgi:translation initiation factor 3 subunit M